MWYLIVSIPDLCTLTYFACVLIGQYTGSVTLASKVYTCVYMGQSIGSGTLVSEGSYMC